MIKLGSVIPYLKKIQKINKSYDAPLEFIIFHRKPANFVISRNTHIRYRHIMILLINIITILMASAQMATLDLLKIKLF